MGKVIAQNYVLFSLKGFPPRIQCWMLLAASVPGSERSTEKMKRITLLIAALLAFSSSAWALVTTNITVSYGLVSGTPTLSDTMLIALAVLLPIVAIRVMRKKQGSLLMMMVLMLGVSAFEVFTGIPLIVKSFAGGGIALVAGTTSYTYNSVSSGSTISVYNNTGSPQTINGLSNTQGWNFVAPTGKGQIQCQIGTPVANATSCYIKVVAPA